MTENLKHRHNAFTLAEVLLVLMIIGIISVLTVPNLMSSTDQAAHIAGTKKAHSTLNQALEKTKATFGHFPRCYYWNGNSPYAGKIQLEAVRNEQGEVVSYVQVNLETGERTPGVPSGWNGNYADCAEFFDAFFKNLNIQKECKRGAAKDGCISNNFKGTDDIIKDKGGSDYDATASTSGCGGHRTASVKNNTNTKVLGDGMVIVPYSLTGAPIILVDTNGTRGPNKMGYDVAVFQLKGDSEDSAWYPGGCEGVAKGGLSTQARLMHK